MSTCPKTCSRTRWTLPCRRWTSSTSRRISPLSSKRCSRSVVGALHVHPQFPLIFSLILLQEFDKKYNPTWHCIVGRNFGSYVTHETKHFIYFYLGQVAILLFKSGWNPNMPLQKSLFLLPSLPPPFFSFHAVHLLQPSFCRHAFLPVSCLPLATPLCHYIVA